jgi:hypothetical protein
LSAPFDTAVALSILHNLTPLAFLWEITRDGSRRGMTRAGVMPVAGLAFIGLPLLVATGLPRLLLESWGLAMSEADPLGAGPLASQLYVYVPAPLLNGAAAVDLFSASVVAQCAHYAAVIVVLPVMLAARDPEARGIIGWPKAPGFAVLLAGVSAVVLYRFAMGFAPARALYGIAASVHAWIEVPLVVMALTRAAGQPSKTSPATAEAALAIVDTTSARSGGSPLAQ